MAGPGRQRWRILVGYNGGSFESLAVPSGNTMKLWFASGVFLLIAGVGGEPGAKHGDGSYPPANGELHPTLVLPSAKDGSALALSGFAGQRVLLVHFSAATKKCRDAIVEWDATTKDLVKNHQLVVWGVCHDASPAQAQLFMQWKRIGWPIAHDVLNQNGIENLPLVIYINEKGIVKQVDPESGKLATKLAKSKALKPKEIPEEDREQLRDPKSTRRAASEGRSAEALCLHGEALIIAGLPAQIDEAVEVFSKASQSEPGNVRAWFGLGVAHQIRHQRGGSADSKGDDDSKAAAQAWKKVRELAPDNEVLKIEIQQFKKKSGDVEKMFGWVEEARKEIIARGEKPVDVP
jgi:peroxiredoxin